MSTEARSSAAQDDQPGATRSTDSSAASAPEAQERRSTAGTHPAMGRRESQRRAKTAAIIEAATRLFREHGYEAVTTQQLSREAGVTNGAFFRHVGSKSDLLIRVVNGQLASGYSQALASLSRGATAAEAIRDLLIPLRDFSLEHPELATAYVREVLFASGSLAEGSLEQINRMQLAIREILEQSDAERAGERPEGFYEFASNVMFSTMSMEIVRAAMGRAEVASLPERFRVMIDQMVQMLLA